MTFATTATLRTLSKKGTSARLPSNAEIAELLAIEAEKDKASPILQRAYRRAARSAFLWPVEAADLLVQERSLTELQHVGPHLEKKIRELILKRKRISRPSPLRKGFLTMAKCRNLLARHPEWAGRLRGDLQMHTRWSDGSGEIRSMADSAIGRGYEFIAITDHSKGLTIANGMNEATLSKQVLEIKRVNEQLQSEGKRLTVFCSVELNLSPAGTGDMASSSLRELDLVLGSFHSALRRKEDQTARYLAALENPDLQILGHPQGRIYNYRGGLTANWEKVLARAAELDKAVEIDAYPDRQDLNVALLKIAARFGTRISIGTDAHHPWQLEFIDLALGAAWTAKIRAERIINFMSAREIRDWVEKVRRAERRRQKREVL